MEPTFRPVIFSPWKLVFLILGVGLMLFLHYYPPQFGKKPEYPKVVIQNATPCQAQNNAQIALENFVSGMPQSICGDMTTDKSPLHLTLIIHPADNVWMTAYVISDDYKPGAISFSIDPPLPPGRYRALIMYARTTFADIYFDVSE